MGDGDSKNGKIRSQKHNGITWFDVQSPDAATFTQLEQQFHLHPLFLKESIAKIQHTQVERESDYLFLVLHFPVLQSRATKLAVGQVGVFLGKDYVLTVHSNMGSFTQSLYAESGYSQEQAEKYFGQGSAYLLYSIIHRMLEDMGRMTEVIEDELDEIEGLVFENSSSDAQRIGRIRQKIVKLRRLIGPKRTVLQDLASQINSFAGTDVSRYYESNVKLVNKLWEGIEEAKETVEIYKDADFTTSTERTNKILAVLTLVFTFTIPMTVIASLYGMNVHLPGGLQEADWTFLGQYTSFYLVVIVSALVALGMYVYVKRKDWF
ncbi:MAG TPA: magnesium transporter CorA family protein [Candidatus Saccharimonadales bacterium]|nr:magnesium transporter CorA family protein [Candidatus Saccharimonadales bacterium]